MLSKRSFSALTCLVFVSASAFLVGCASPAPNYAPSINNVEQLKKSQAAPAKVGGFDTQAGMKNVDAIRLRASSMVSPVGKHYGDYLAAALRSELELARLHDLKSPLEISGTLQHNNINAGGFQTNDGQLEARFIVKDGTQVRYDKVKKIEHQWEGAFVGAVGIPQAAGNYPIMVQKLLGELFADPDFIVAIKKN